MLSTQPNVAQSKDVVSLSKLIHFYKYESEISLEAGRAFMMNRRGQIQEIDVEKFNHHKDPSNLKSFMKNAEQVHMTAPIRLNKTEIPGYKKNKTVRNKPLGESPSQPFMRKMTGELEQLRSIANTSHHSATRVFPIASRVPEERASPKFIKAFNNANGSGGPSQDMDSNYQSLGRKNSNQVTKLIGLHSKKSSRLGGYEQMHDSARKSLMENPALGKTPSSDDSH